MLFGPGDPGNGKVRGGRRESEVSVGSDGGGAKRSARGGASGARTRVGICARCGVTFVASDADRRVTGAALRAHERVCPGGDRSGETVEPMAALRAP
jgi:hypothetical protein